MGYICEVDEHLLFLNCNMLNGASAFFYTQLSAIKAKVFKLPTRSFSDSIAHLRASHTGLINSYF